MTAHSQATTVHRPYSWEYDDEAEREAATGFVPADVGKLARQLDDNSLWMLTDDDPETWVQVGGSGGGRTLISEVVAPGGTNIVTFSSIPGTYKSLEIEFVARSTAPANNDVMKMEYNNDTTAGNYRNTYDQTYGGSPGSSGGSGADNAEIAHLSAANSPANSPGAGNIYIPGYADTTFNKVAHSEFSYRFDNSSLHMIIVELGHEWESTAAITEIDLKMTNGNFVANSKFRLYGRT